MSAATEALCRRVHDNMARPALLHALGAIMACRGRATSSGVSAALCAQPPAGRGLVEGVGWRAPGAWHRMAPNRLRSGSDLQQGCGRRVDRADHAWQPRAGPHAVTRRCHSTPLHPLHPRRGQDERGPRGHAPRERSPEAWGAKCGKRRRLALPAQQSPGHAHGHAAGARRVPPSPDRLALCLPHPPTRARAVARASCPR